MQRLNPTNLGGSRESIVSIGDVVPLYKSDRDEILKSPDKGRQRSETQQQQQQQQQLVSVSVFPKSFQTSFGTKGLILPPSKGHSILPRSDNSLERHNFLSPDDETNDTAAATESSLVKEEPNPNRERIIVSIPRKKNVAKKSISPEVPLKRNEPPVLTRDFFRLRKEDLLYIETIERMQCGEFAQWSIVAVKGSRSSSSNNDDDNDNVLPERRRAPKLYTCKSIVHSKESEQTPESIQAAASKLAFEAELLSGLNHPNVPTIYARYEPERDRILDSNFFYLIESVLLETLADRIRGWRGHRKSDTTTTTSGLPQASQESARDWKSSWQANYGEARMSPSFESHRASGEHQNEVCIRRTMEKLLICQELASALEYIHSKKIVIRNLSPETIGFVVKSGHRKVSSGFTTLQLFEFGSCRCLNNKNNSNDDPTIDEGDSFQESVLRKIRSTKNSETNSSLAFVDWETNHRCPCYTSPEICLGLPYDCDSDIYSYSMICWEIWSHQAPYQNLSPSMHLEFVCKREHRPVQQIVHYPVVGYRQPESILPPLSHDFIAASLFPSFPLPNCRRIFSTFETWTPSSVPIGSNGAQHVQQPTTTTTCMPADATCEEETFVFIPGSVPSDVKTLLSQAWRARPKSRIRWPGIQTQLSLLQRIEQLKLERHLQNVLLSRLRSLALSDHNVVDNNHD